MGIKTRNEYKHTLVGKFFFFSQFMKLKVDLQTINLKPSFLLSNLHFFISSESQRRQGLVRGLFPAQEHASDSANTNARRLSLAYSLKLQFLLQTKV